MTRLLYASRKTVMFAASLVCLLSVIALTVAVKTNSQQRQVLNQNSKDTLLKQVENSMDLPLRVAGNENCPFRIIQATVKEISGSDFTRLTGKTTDLVTVSSNPEVKLVNTSGKTITGFVIAIRDPQSQTTSTLVNLKASIPPGESYIVKREQFVKSEKATVASGGQVRETLVQPKMDSEKYWLQFAGRSDIFITVGAVMLNDGSRWMIKDGGDVK